MERQATVSVQCNANYQHMYISYIIKLTIVLDTLSHFVLVSLTKTRKWKISTSDKTLSVFLSYT
jgi:hypothetical protein